MTITDPQFASPHRYLSLVYLREKDYPHYLAQVRRDADLTHDADLLERAAAAERGYRVGGRKGLLHGLIEVLTSELAAGRGDVIELVEMATLAGDKVAGIRYLRVALEKNHIPPVAIRAAPWADVGNEPAYQQILHDAESRKTSADGTQKREN